MQAGSDLCRADQSWRINPGGFFSPYLLPHVSETYMGMKVAEIIVEVLEQAGVKRCYGIVGDTLNLFAENLEP
jgi:hypothetical protein